VYRVEFDSWYEESFLGGGAVAVTGEAAPAAVIAGGSNANLQTSTAAAGKSESLTKADACVSYYTKFG